MSVAVMSIQQSYMEPYIHSLSTSLSDSDSDVGYGTPAEKEFVAEQQSQKKEMVADPILLVQDGSGEIATDPDLLKIMKQVEWYFSDENLLKDSFLMKHINRNKQGYVSLKLVASLRKVKALSKDWTVVLKSLMQSDVLALNEEETKIRRKSPAPQVDFRHIAKTLLITGYPQQEPNQADIEQHFGRYGEVTQVRLVQPGRAIPLDVKPCKAQHPSLGKDLCILIEFGSEELAKLAQKRIREQQSWRDEMKVQLLGEKSVSREQEPPKDSEDRSSRLSSKKSSKNSETQSQMAKQQKGLYHNKESWLRDSFSPSPRSSREGTPTKQLFQRKVSSPSAETHRRWKPQPQGVKCSPELSRKYLRPDAWKDYSSDSGMSCGSRSSSESPKYTPEPSRKFFSGNNTELSWRSADRHSQLTSCVIRQPLGPDGTKGFAKPRLSQS